MGCGGSKKQDVADPSAVELDEPSVAQAVAETLEVKAQPAKAAEMMRQVSSGKIAVSPASAGAAELMRKMSTGKIELPPAEEEAPEEAAAAKAAEEAVVAATKRLPGNGCGNSCRISRVGR